MGGSAASGTIRVLMAILAHADARSLRELVDNVRAFCPGADLVLYDSGADPHLGDGLDVERFPVPRRLEYSQVTPFFLDVCEWLSAEGRDYDYWVNLETDMLFVRSGYVHFLRETMSGYDYMAPLFARHNPRTSRWRPIRTLRPELPRWYAVLGFEHTHRGFSPGQVFARRYVDELVGHERYPEIRRLVAENRSNSLQEVLFPTLVDFLGQRGRSYPEEWAPINRYRPFQAVRGVRRALGLSDVHFVHPVRRDPDDPARRLVLSLSPTAEA